MFDAAFWRDQGGALSGSRAAAPPSRSDALRRFVLGIA